MTNYVRPTSNDVVVHSDMLTVLIDPDLRGSSSSVSRVLSESFGTLGPEPAFGRLGLGGSSGECSSHGYTSHALLRAYSAQLGGDRFFEFRESECQRGPSLMEIRD